MSASLLGGLLMKVRRISLALVLGIVFMNLFALTPANAIVEKCPTFNFKHLFNADYTTGSHWDNSEGDLQIRWSLGSTFINDEKTLRPFTETEIGWIRAAFNSWDESLNSVSFIEVDPTQAPQISIGFVELLPSPIQPNAIAFWSAWTTNLIRYRASIKLKASKTRWYSDQSQFIHTLQHEIGNVLGLGDIAPDLAMISVMEDPWQPPYGRLHLGKTDVEMIRQMYSESSCVPRSTLSKIS